MSVFIAILVLSLLIIIHEIGHFAAAKILGVKVIEFSLFMGPRLLSFTKGETRYSIKLIPIGGSCMMEGEEASSSDERALNHKPKWARAVIFAAGPFLNLTMALIMILCINIYSGYMTCEVSYVGDYSAAATASVPIAEGDEIMSYAGKRVHVPSEILIYLQDTKGAPVGMTFKRSGEVYSTVVKPEFTPGKRHILGFTGAQPVGPDWNLIASVSEGDPADLLGLQPGDRLITVAGETPTSREELRTIFADSGGGEVEVAWVKADGTPASGIIAPKLTNDQDSYSLGLAYKPKSGAGFGEQINNAYYTAISYSKMVIYSLKWMVTGAIGLNQVSGPVGIVAEIGAGVDETINSPNGIQVMIVYLVNLSALIGINLGLFNLIPFPPLDGSKLLLLGIEAIRRKDIPPERQMAISMFGFAVLILVMALTLFNDIAKIIAR